MTRLSLLRAGYGAFALSFAAFAGSTYLGALLILGLVLALVGGALLAFSDDDLPKWAGLAMVAYFVLMVVVFLAGTPITIDKGGGYFVNAAPPELASAVFFYLSSVAPVMLAGTALAATWERERGVRLLLMGALAATALFALLTFVLVPGGETDLEVAAAAQQQGTLLKVLAALGGLCGMAACGWAAARPEEVD